MNKRNDVLVIHDDDADGFGCAWAYWRSEEKPADYLPVRHGTKQIPQEAFNYRKVYVFDESFPRSEYVSLLNAGVKVYTIDHHETSEETHKKLGINLVEPQNNAEAACVQVWDFFHEGWARPKLLEYVADRDVWKWELPDSEAVNAYIYTFDTREFYMWDSINYSLCKEFEDIVNIGYAINKYKNLLVDQIVSNTFKISEGIPQVSSPILQSEVGHRLLEMYPDAPFVIISSDIPGERVRKISLRSDYDRLDVGRIAELNGGGGHRNAAGFYVPYEQIWEDKGVIIKGI